MPVTPLTDTRPYASDRVPTPSRPVRLGARDLDTDELLTAHKHAWGQVTYALEGVFRVTVGNNSWIAPPLRAIWIPPEVVHEVVIVEKARLRPLLIDASASPFPGHDCHVLNVSPLLRELIVALSQLDTPGGRESLIAGLLLDELRQSDTLPMRIALPADKRLKSLCETLIEQELGMSFGQWRQQMRLAHAAPLIARGLPLSQVALELGYASQSAFSAMFKKTFGQTPSEFFAQSRR